MKLNNMVFDCIWEMISRRNKYSANIYKDKNKIHINIISGINIIKISFECINDSLDFTYINKYLSSIK